ncbi:hypothetical protein X471_00601 [Bartonella bacilliformis str. Heidi Mejia]|uniref:Uncharacterized protein n=1 Tax=Bartonella bacilliformis (strain ATCC 35685 / KC583 / Herrer 020/F12,63) TaxID=360095 RepID=A1URX3_BARBK|nr:hypothetical protein BARBAKC583_0407 [Bartonella bacilliformis KC583]EYS90139.1 hypothetical protein X472_00595 [Bartonella bacilliformis San Pedro600-02]EYS92303.1 hypothetical protein X471_00601 [Bartonella bacilliformis str. Heidi Mejia]EYS94958.1 hypothetical protein X470_00468 [Bartonella bacilliformis Peru-18]KEG17631.1 hypothetical protein H709_00361 [Bartonella bacilliformis CUSCO5]KEG18626.1 hypothetical protein H707_00348 [Bartonella bacilliformis Hosp800-02]KEG20839.1 hypothetic
MVHGIEENFLTLYEKFISKNHLFFCVVILQSFNLVKMGFYT